MSDYTETQLVSAMRRLNGEICTMSHMRGFARELESRGLMRFHEWPSGHWSITEKGRNFLRDYA